MLSELKLRTGTKVFIRTVTYHYTGRVVDYNDDWIILDDAAWIADSGRFSVALSTGELSEVEPYPGQCWINRPGVIDLSEWSHELPREVK